MREVIAVCRSRKSSREKVATILDRYLWRIGNRTWRGKASNACLDRISRELRSVASRATAVSIQEIRSSHESRMPLVRIGSRSAFSEEGLAPVASHPSEFGYAVGTRCEENGLAIVRIAALFHDFGKATKLFQDKLKRALRGAGGEGDAIRHELFSAFVWDRLVGQNNDHDLIKILKGITRENVDNACARAKELLGTIDLNGKRKLGFEFLRDPHSIAFSIGMLILTHHRLPEGDSDHLTILGKQHVRPSENFSRSALDLASGEPFWHEDWWLRHLRKDAERLAPGAGAPGLDIALRASLVFADHLGSARKRASERCDGHLANTTIIKGGKPVSADSLSMHIRKVYSHCRSAFDMLHRLRNHFPALDENSLPVELVRPVTELPRFQWQVDAAKLAKGLCAINEGGFFGCILAGTGSGKTRGAPTILAAAAFGDARPERRYFRMTLGLGLRVLATQSAREYVEDLGLPDEDVRVLIGQKPINFDDQDGGEIAGSESEDILPEWLRVEAAGGRIPEEESDQELNWLRGLSLNTDRGVPAFLSMVVEHARKKGHVFQQLASAPILVATVDHLMSVATPVKSGFLAASLRVLTADLVLDEIDQYGAEDLAAIARLVFQVAAGGRRAIIMSATIPRDVAETLYTAYSAGWKEYARMKGAPNHVNILCTGDAPGSCVTNVEGMAFSDIYTQCSARVLSALAAVDPLRRGEFLPPVEDWKTLVDQIDLACSRMHDLNKTEMDGFQVSIGLVRMTRISHTAALAVQIPSGNIRRRLRLKLCLHSNFPRLHRAWIENRLKRALSRKGPDSDRGLRSFCHELEVFRRASAIDVRDIEIVCVTSPVIETGNDLDFDYAIIDPVSLRSVVQSAGRVRRHRYGLWRETNILMLDRSPIVMQGGRLAMPGVETAPNSATRVSKVLLDKFPDRRFPELIGRVRFDSVTAAAILSEAEACPLREAEQKLREKMLCCEGSSPVGIYIGQVAARMNREFTKSRRFRRSTTRSVLYTKVGGSLTSAEWRVNLVPHERGSRFVGLNRDQIHEINYPEDGILVPTITERAWLNFSGGRHEMSESDIRRFFEVNIPMYADFEDHVIPTITYSEFTGLTRGPSDNLFKPFGS